MWKKNIYLVVGLAVISISTVSASSFQLWQQSGSSAGDIAAGAAAIANDATTAYYNPAGSIRAKNQDVAISFLGKITNTKFKGELQPTPSISGFSNSGTTQGGDSDVIPTLSYIAPLNDSWAFGFSISTPFYANTNYTNSTFARYVVTKNVLKTYDISPSLSFRPLDHFSIGAGLDAEHLKWEYDHYDTTASTANEALVTTELTDWAWGWNAGFLWEITSSTRLGMSYHSKMVEHLGGKSEFNSFSSRARANVYLPALWIGSIYHEFNDSFAMMGTVTYTQWKKSKDFTFTNLSGNVAPNAITLQDAMQNAWLFIVGAHYHITPAFLLRAGIGYDISPNRTSSRNIILPDANQGLIALGLGYQLTNTIHFDVGYTHIMMQHISINHTQPYASHVIKVSGNIEQNADILGLQINWLML